MTETELFEQKGIVAEHVCSFLCARKRCDRVSLRFAVVRLGCNLVLIRGRGARTEFPMTRTGFLSCLGLNGGRRSTERTGHPYNV